MNDALWGHVGPQESLFPFFLVTPTRYTQSRDTGVRPAPWGAFRLRGNEVVFSDGAGFEPRTS